MNDKMTSEFPFQLIVDKPTSDGLEAVRVLAQWPRKGVQPLIQESSLVQTTSILSFVDLVNHAF